MGYVMRTKPFAQHQWDAITWLSERERGALLLPMGTGKTYIMLAALSLVDGPTLVVAPLSVLNNWKREIETHTRASCVVATGPKDERLRALRSDVDFVIINYDYFSRFPSEHAKLFRRFDNVVLDESTRIKSPTAKRTCTIIELFQYARRRYILTGTPITRDYTDVWSQWLFLDLGRTFGDNLWKFKRTYFNPVDYGAGRRSWEIARNGPSRIRNAISGTYFYRKKSDCVDLPPKIYERVYYSLAKDQLSVYSQILRDWMAELEGEEVVVNNALARDMLLRQICSGFMGSRKDGVLREFKSPKLEIFKEVVEDIGNAQFIVWYNFTREGADIERVLSENGIKAGRIAGGVSASERHHTLESFAAGDVQCVYLQIQSGAYGINELARSPYSIYYSNSYDYDLRAQSEDRTSRKGSEDSCTYVDIVGTKTIEEAILDVLEMKQHMTPAVFKQNLYTTLKEMAA